MSIKDIPAIPHEAMAKLLETFKNEVFDRLDKLDRSLPQIIDKHIKAKNKATWARRKEKLKYFYGGIPAGIVVLIGQLLI